MANVDIQLPRLENESTKAYQARLEYVTMGPQRSQDAVSQKLGKSRQLMYRWSVQYGWASSAEKYDADVHYLTIQDAADKYRADLEKHRTEASDAGAALYTVSGQLIKAINAALAGPKRIEGKDGKIYTIHSIEMNANTFSIAARAMQTALDLKAHALGVDKLLPSLTDDSE
jgi:hypothetical protein